jgi:competence protein ComEA
MRLLSGKFGAVLVAGSILMASGLGLMSQTVASAPAPQATDEWPNGPGKATFLQTCSVCHSPENVLGHNLSSDEWTDLLNKMVQYGAQGSDADFSAILNYLSTNFPPAPAKVNVNTATAMNFRNWLGMQEAMAESIVAYRAQHGDFKSLDDLKAVPDVDPKFLYSIKDLLTYDPAPAATPSAS